MSWKVQVKDRVGNWQDVPSPPYTQDQALRVMSRCFSEQVHAFVYGGGEQTVRVFGGQPGNS